MIKICYKMFSETQNNCPTGFSVPSIFAFPPKKLSAHPRRTQKRTCSAAHTGPKATKGGVRGTNALVGGACLHHSTEQEQGHWQDGAGVASHGQGQAAKGPAETGGQTLKRMHMYVRMYVRMCVYICMCVCTYICTHTHIYVHIYCTFVYIFMCACTHVCIEMWNICVCKYACACTYVYIGVCLRVYMSVWMCVYTCVYICMHVCTCMRTHTYTHAYMRAEWMEGKWTSAGT